MPFPGDITHLALEIRLNKQAYLAETNKQGYIWGYITTSGDCLPLFTESLMSAFSSYQRATFILSCLRLVHITAQSLSASVVQAVAGVRSPQHWR